MGCYHEDTFLGSFEKTKDTQTVDFININVPH